MNARFLLIAGLLLAAGAEARAEPRVATNTERVAALAADEASLWVATEGGLERYDRASGARLRLYTPLDGLAEASVLDVAVRAGVVEARSRRALCTLDRARDSFACADAPERAPVPRLLGTFEGHRVSARLAIGDERYVGTAGGGLYREGTPPRRLSPEGQLCANHVVDVVPHAGAIYLGTFDDGLCVAEGDAFRRLEAPFRMVNDLVSTPAGLFVATSDGLYVTRDGRSFTRHRRLVRATTGLAFDGRSLYVSTAASLHRVRVAGGPRPMDLFRPGGSTAIQDLALAPDGTVWLATEDRGAVRVRGDAIAIFDRAAGLPSSWALAVDVATDGTAYVGTLRHGLVAIAPDGSHRRVPLPDAWVLGVRATDDGRVLVGTQAGAFVVASGGGTPVGPLPDRRVHDVRPIDGALFVATEGGLAVISGLEDGP